MSRAVVGAVLGLAALSAYNALYFFPVTVDDAFISLRYAWNLAEGLGFVFNPGERVEGYSNPSWTLLATAFLLLDIEPLAALKWTGVLCSAAVPPLAWWHPWFWYCSLVVVLRISFPRKLCNCCSPVVLLTRYQ
jgi:hypothetical protein